MNRIFRIVLLCTITAVFFVFMTMKWISINTKNESKYEVIAVLKSRETAASPFWASVEEGLSTAADDYKVSLQIFAPEKENDIFAQIEILEKIPMLRPDAVLLAAADTRLVLSALAAIQKKGIPLVFIDSFAGESEGDCRIGMDNYDAGSAAAEVIESRLERRSLIAVLSYVQGSSTAIDREKGLADGLKGDMNLLPTYYTGGSIAAAYSWTKHLLTHVENLDGIVCLNNNSTIGAMRAVREKGLGSEILLLGFGSSPEILSYIQSGAFSSVIAQKPFNIGYLGVRTVVEILEKKRVAEFIDTGHLVINRDNLFTAENQKILFPVQPR